MRNHLSTAHLREQMPPDLFVRHGCYTELWLDDRRIEPKPAIIIELCDRFGRSPLNCNGESDALHHCFDRIRNQHREYAHERGTFDDIPNEQIAADVAGEAVGTSRTGSA